MGENYYDLAKSLNLGPIGYGHHYLYVRIDRIVSISIEQLMNAVVCDGVCSRNKFKTIRSLSVFFTIAINGDGFTQYGCKWDK